MSDKKTDKIRQDILEALLEEFTQDQIPAKLTQKDENGFLELAVMLENAAVDGQDALGEFFFLPSSEEDEVQFFVNLITLSEDLKEENIGGLATVTAALNSYVITGAFAIDYAAKSLVYKHTYEMPIDADEERLRDGVDISMGASLQTVDNYGHFLIDVKEGRMTADDVLKIFFNQIAQ